MPGRPPKPTALKLVSGNPGKRALNKQEPDPEYLQNLDPPEWLHPDAAAIWRELAPHAAKAKVLTVLDREAFAQGCEAVAQYRRATLAANSRPVDNASKDEAGLDQGGTNISPWVMLQSMSFKRCQAFFNAFGMNPVARTRIMIQPQGDLFSNGKASAAASYFS